MRLTAAVTLCCYGKGKHIAKSQSVVKYGDMQ